MASRLCAGAFLGSLGFLFQGTKYFIEEDLTE